MGQVLLCDPKAAPSPLAEYLPRPRLRQRVNGILHHKLTLVCAPAGAGKTTLLREFAARTNASTLWYRLEPTDQEPFTLASRLGCALAAHLDSRGLQDSRLPESQQDEGALPRLVRALSEAAAATHGPLVLILDDCDKVDAVEAVNGLLARICYLTPGDVHLVVSSRSRPTLPLARLRLNGELLELTQEDLALDANEVAAFLAWRGLRLGEEEVQLVLARTRGWVAGVSMLTESLMSRDRREVIRFLRDFGGGCGIVRDYFAEEVLRQQSPAVQQFLVATSLLGELHRDLVNLFLRIRDAEGRLDSLEANNLFTRRLDGEGDLYEYHPLFHEFLRAEAKRRLGRAGLADLHRRAASAYTSRRNWERAIDHLLAARSFTRAAAAIERVGNELVEEGRLEPVQRWLSSLPEAMKRYSPWLLALEGRIAREEGDHRRAAAALARAQTMFTERSDSSGLARVVVERALVLYNTGNCRQSIELLEQGPRWGTDGWMPVEVLLTLSLCYRATGDLSRSARLGETALDALGPRDGSGSRLRLESRTLRVLAQTLLLQGDLDRALCLTLRAGDLCFKEQLGGLELGWALASLGLVRAVRGESGLALQALREAEQQGADRFEAPRRKLALWRGNVYTDLGDFARAELCYQVAGLPPAEHGWLFLRQRQAGRAITIAEEALSRPAGRESPLQEAALLGVLGMATGAGGEPQKGSRLLRRAATILAEHGYVQHLASLQLHLAGLEIESGHLALARRLLGETLARAESRGFYHFYWWDPELLARLLPLAMEDDRRRPYAERLARLHRGAADQRALSALSGRVGLRGTEPGAGGGAGARGIAGLLASCTDATTRAHITEALSRDHLASSCVPRLRDGFGLTWREIEVFLAYYADRPFVESSESASLRRRLAEELGMSESTLKSHVRNIRAKLGVPTGADSLQVYRTAMEREHLRARVGGLVHLEPRLRGLAAENQPAG